LDFGFRILDFGFWILDILDFGFRILDFGFWKDFFLLGVVCQALKSRSWSAFANGQR